MQAVCVCQGVDSNCLQSQFLAGTYHPDSYLPSIRNEDLHQSCLGVLQICPKSAA